MAANEIFIAADHAGFALKEFLKAQMPQISWVDLGPTDTSRVDYPDYADRLACRVAQGKGRGVLICGSGQGMAIRANRYSGVRAALVWNDESITLARAHNDANVICLGARLLEPELCVRLVEIFISTAFEGGRHQDRIVKLGLAPKDGC